MNKIAILGVSGVGKDYVVKTMVTKYGFNRISFSDQLKKLAVKIYPWMKKDYPPEEKEKPLNIVVPKTGELISKTPREIWLSLNSLRNSEDGLFVRMLQEELLLLNVDSIVISDVRTQNEYDWCKENGFTFVLIKTKTPIHRENGFDDFVRNIEKDGLYDHEFTNNFDGENEIRSFIENYLVSVS